MPNKTIYVADADLPVFEQAQEMAGGTLSAVIAEALRQFIETEEAKKNEFRDVTIKVGRSGAWREQRFQGRLLARWHGKDQRPGHVELVTIYQTAHQRLAVYIRSVPEWSAWTAMMGGDDEPGAHNERHSGRDPRDPRDPRVMRLRARGAAMLNGPRPAPWPRTWDEGSEHRLELYETLEQLKAVAPPDLYLAVEHALNGSTVEVLDI